MQLEGVAAHSSIFMTCWQPVGFRGQGRSERYGTFRLAGLRQLMTPAKVPTTKREEPREDGKPADYGGGLMPNHVQRANAFTIIYLQLRHGADRNFGLL